MQLLHVEIMWDALDWCGCCGCSCDVGVDVDAIVQRHHMKLAVRALGLLISANPAVGILIVTYGMAKKEGAKDGGKL